MAAGRHILVTVTMVATVLVCCALASAACVRPASESRLEGLLICPSCHTPLDESNSPAAQQIKQALRTMVAQCMTERQILRVMVANFGAKILATPQTHGFDLIAWVLPIGGGLAAAVGLAVAAYFWSRRGGSDDDEDDGHQGGDADDEHGLSADDEARVDEALSQFV